MLLEPPNLLRRAAVALAVGVGMAELKAVPLVELTEEAEGVTEGRAALPTCAQSPQILIRLCLWDSLVNKLLGTRGELIGNISSFTHCYCLVSRLSGDSRARGEASVCDYGTFCAKCQWQCLWNGARSVQGVIDMLGGGGRLVGWGVGGGT